MPPEFPQGLVPIIHKMLLKIEKFVVNFEKKKNVSIYRDLESPLRVNLRNRFYETYPKKP